MKALLTEIRDWLGFALSGLGLSLAWRWRPRRKCRTVTIHAPNAAAFASVLNSSASLALTTGT